MNTIPALRSIANDVVLDVLLYLTPNYCFEVLESVTDQINAVYGVFTKINPKYLSRGGKFSLIGHSLGSVILWDLLSLKKNSTQNDGGVQIMDASNKRTSQQIGVCGKDLFENAAEKDLGCWGPSLPKPFEKDLPFKPEITIFLGSPVGLFLSLRGAHAAFDSIRDSHPKKPQVSPFKLPSGAIYNIFSPSDPVAYRIEPLLLAQNTKDRPPEPAYLTRIGESVRFHVKAMQFGDEIRKKSWSLFKGKNSQKDTTMMDEEPANTLVPTKTNEVLKFALGGKSLRVDFQLQPGVIENEYLASVSAHSNYFCNHDIMDFISDLTAAKPVVDLTNDDSIASENVEMIVSSK